MLRDTSMHFEKLGKRIILNVIDYVIHNLSLIKIILAPFKSLFPVRYI